MKVLRNSRSHRSPHELLAEDKFARLWAMATTLAEFCYWTHYKRGAAKVRASRMRKRGISLKKFNG